MARGRVNRERLGELIAGGMSEGTAKRQERAERAGFTSYGAHEYAQRKAKAERLGYDGGYRQARQARDEARRTGDTAQLRGGDRPGGTPRRQVFAVPGGVVVRTRPGAMASASTGPLHTALRNAPRGAQAKVVVTLTDGTSRTLYGKGGRSAASIRNAMDIGGYDDLVDFIGDEMGDVYGDAYSGGGGGAPASSLIASVQLVISK